MAVSPPRYSKEELTSSLFKRIPDAQPWIVRIGHRAVHRFGARSLKKTI